MAAGRMPVLVSLAGLPGVGKSTIAAALSRESGAVFLRIDEIETAIGTANPDWTFRGPEAYHIAAALAASNLALGHDVIVDSYNPWPVTRAIYRDAAARAGARHLGVEIRCSDAVIHRRRVETRKADIPGQTLPDWEDVSGRPFEPWDDADLSLDAARVPVEGAVEAIRASMREAAGSG